MAKTLKLSFDTEESIRTLIITNPKEDVTREECEEAMTEIVESGAFEGLIGPVKAVMVESETETIYEC